MRKYAALTECDCIPSWESMKSEDALWLIVAPWTGHYLFGTGNDRHFWQSLLNSEGVVSK